MLLNLFKKSIPDCGVSFSPVVNLLTPVAVSVDGVAVRRSEFQPFDIAGSLISFNSTDFSIQNLESIGALSTLKTTYMSNLHDMNVADKFENYVITAESSQN